MSNIREETYISIPLHSWSKRAAELIEAVEAFYPKRRCLATNWKEFQAWNAGSAQKEEELRAVMSVSIPKAELLSADDTVIGEIHSLKASDAEQPLRHSQFITAMREGGAWTGKLSRVPEEGSKLAVCYIRPDYQWRNDDKRVVDGIVDLLQMATAMIAGEARNQKAAKVRFCSKKNIELWSGNGDTRTAVSILSHVVEATLKELEAFADFIPLMKKPLTEKNAPVKRYIEVWGADSWNLLHGESVSNPFMLAAVKPTEERWQQSLKEVMDGDIGKFTDLVYIS